MIQCNECPAEYHVSCAWKFGHKFGFEIQQVRPPQDGMQTRRQAKLASIALAQAKNSRREGTPMVDFKGQSGLMVPSVICKGHGNHKPQVYDICDTNDAGEVRSSSVPLVVWDPCYLESDYRFYRVCYPDDAPDLLQEL